MILRYYYETANNLMLQVISENKEDVAKLLEVSKSNKKDTIKFEATFITSKVTFLINKTFNEIKK